MEENVILKDWNKDHVCMFYEMTDCKDVMRWMYRQRTTLKDALLEWERWSGFRNAIYVDNQYVGDIWAKPSDFGMLLGCCIFDMEYWNRGVASRALHQFLNRYDMSCANAFVYAENKGSIRVMEKLGFVRVDSFVEKGCLAYLYRWERKNGSEN